MIEQSREPSSFRSSFWTALPAYLLVAGAIVALGVGAALLFNERAPNAGAPAAKAAPEKQPVENKQDAHGKAATARVVPEKRSAGKTPDADKAVATKPVPDKRPIENKMDADDEAAENPGVRDLRLAIAVIQLLWEAPGDRRSDRKQCESIVPMIESGKLREKEPGIVRLPSNLADVTKDQSPVYVTHRKNGNLYLFILWHGKGTNLHGYLYTTIPHRDMKIQDVDQFGQAGHSIEIEVPDPMDLLRNHGPPSAMGPVDIRETDWAGWYEVTSDLE